MSPRFLFAVCQRGAEEALKREAARHAPELLLAFSRPGFVTFKVPESISAEAKIELRSPFARTQGVSLGCVQGTTARALAAEVWQVASALDIDLIHVWQRDRAVPGEKGFEPGPTPLAAEIGRMIAAAAPGSDSAAPLPVNQTARVGQCVLDCAVVEPNQWWIGYHTASSPSSRWSGGTPPLALPLHAVSRAYLKMQEALLWSRLPLRAGEACVEIGSAPGGSCQALLDRGLLVTGIDPAEMDPAVVAHPNFTHVRARGADLKRREFRHTRWLTVDSNVPPQHTLDTVEHIVTNRQVHVRGLLLTLKLSGWDLAAAVPEYIDRVRSWGYHYVNARQLAFNRQEITLAALRSRRDLRPTRRVEQH